MRNYQMNNYKLYLFTYDGYVSVENIWAYAVVVIGIINICLSMYRLIMRSNNSKIENLP